MMAELVQGQASVAQPGMKADGFADALHRARQVKKRQIIAGFGWASIEAFGMGRIAV